MPATLATNALAYFAIALPVLYCWLSKCVVGWLLGATKLSTTTLSTMTLSIITLSIAIINVALSIVKFNNLTLIILLYWV